MYYSFYRLETIGRSNHLTGHLGLSSRFMREDYTPRDLDLTGIISKRTIPNIPHKFHLSYENNTS